MKFHSVAGHTEHIHRHMHFFCVCGRPSHFSTMKAGLTHESLQEIIPLQRVNVLNGTQQTVPVVD